MVEGVDAKAVPLQLGECTAVTRALHGVSFEAKSKGFKVGGRLVAGPATSGSAPLFYVPDADPASEPVDVAVETACTQAQAYQKYTAFTYIDGKKGTPQFVRRICAWEDAGLEATETFRQQYFCARYTACKVQSGGCEVCEAGYKLSDPAADVARACIMLAALGGFPVNHFPARSIASRSARRSPVPLCPLCLRDGQCVD